MRWPVRSRKLHASKMATTRSWISSLSSRCWSGVCLGQGAGGLVDRFRCFQNLLGRLLGAADHGAELTGHLEHLLAVETLAMQHRDLLLGAAHTS